MPWKPRGMRDKRRTANGEYTDETHRNRCAKGWKEAKTMPIVQQPRIANCEGRPTRAAAKDEYTALHGGKGN